MIIRKTLVLVGAVAAFLGGAYVAGAWMHDCHGEVMGVFAVIGVGGVTLLITLIAASLVDILAEIKK